MSEQHDDRLRAKIEPEADGRWLVMIRKLDEYSERTRLQWDSLERMYDVPTTTRARTQKAARRKASRMLKRLRRAIENSRRETVEVDR